MPEINGRIVFGRFVPREQVDVCFLVAVPDKQVSLQPIPFLFCSYHKIAVVIYVLEFGLYDHEECTQDHPPTNVRRALQKVQRRSQRY